jgi:hypothetical protein
MDLTLSAPGAALPVWAAAAAGPQPGRSPLPCVSLDRLPALQTLRLAGSCCSSSSSDALLQDVARCGRLVALALVCTAAVGRGASGAGLAALAESPCSSSLEALELVVELEVLELAQLAQLLRSGRMGRLREVRARVRVPGSSREAGQELRKLLAQQLGNGGGQVQVSCAEAVGVDGDGLMVLDLQVGQQLACRG